ncbi:hypothetical protein HY025_01160 [Candidatus Daviesbacteria bacterium]|nr:hypothetical protein [Candidatus Daviesbacteria bacterium]
MNNFENCVVTNLENTKFCCPRGETIRVLRQDRGDLESMLGSGIDILVTEEINKMDLLINESCKTCPFLQASETDSSKELEKETRRVPVIPRVTTSRWMQQFARSQGLDITRRNGRHPLHIEAPDGSSRPLPDHPGDLSPGVTRSLINWILNNSINRSLVLRGGVNI